MVFFPKWGGRRGGVLIKTVVISWGGEGDGSGE